MAFPRSKLTLLVLSAVLIGGAGAVLAGMSAIRPPSFSAALAANNSTGATNTTGSAASATSAGHSAGGTPGATATGASTASPGASPTNTSVPTPRPTRTPTPIPVVGQQLTVRGDVTSISTSTNTFMVNAFGGGGSYTITVSSSTQWPNPQVSSFSALRVGMQVDAHGTYAGSGNLNPTNSVDADN